MIALSSVLGVVVAQNVFFYLIAAVIVIAALRVVTTDNVLHAALYLVVVLAGVAAQFLLLGAEFVGVTQVLVYIGAVIVLFLFGIMLTRAKVGAEDDLNHDNVWPSILTAVLLFAVLGFGVVDFGSLQDPPTSVSGTVVASPSTVRDVFPDVSGIERINISKLQEHEDSVMSSAISAATREASADGLRGDRLDDAIEEARAEITEDLDEHVDVVVFNTDFSSDPGVRVVGAPVRLWHDGEVVATAVTDNDGNYSFADLASGTYTVERMRAGEESTDSQATAYLTKAKIINVLENDPTTVERVSDSIFSTYIVAFEAISVLLLAALIGAIVVARKE